MCRRIVVTSSICSAGHLPSPDDQPKDYESAMGGMTLDSASLTGTGEQDTEDMEKNPDVKTEGRWIRNKAESEVSK